MGLLETLSAGDKHRSTLAHGFRYSNYGQLNAKNKLAKVTLTQIELLRFHAEIAQHMVAA